MRQILLLILLFFASSWLARKIRQVQTRGGSFPGGFDGAGTASGGAAGGPRAGGSTATDSGTLAEPMVRCAECGVHAPKSDAVATGGDYFCSSEHAARHAAHANHRGRS
ncbi:PP0621 family protein [Burkholderia sp. TSV86]|uniref:PP0621 family protein n=1 Tax=Burkholderia sp. TSV86 TaxID=1385594 RepID=UPI0007540E6F|nr:PP0621 family protein [Burkholderia sp. TSV86]KVE39741.1 deaminase [Burkholderia sp. TSV86]